jgi:F-type H+-transporting ATPase subunit gamma
MATLRDIRTRIKGVKSTAKITSAMKMVSFAKLKRAQNFIESARPYFIGLETMLSNLVAATETEYQHILTRTTDEVRTVALIVIASDRGLCGSFNSNLFKFVNQHIINDINIKYNNPTLKIISVGRKSISVFRKTKHEIIAEFPGIFSKLEYSIAQSIVETVIEPFINKEIDRVLVFRNKFVNVLKQEPTMVTLLPIESDTIQLKKLPNAVTTDYIYEPGVKEIIEELLPKIIDVRVWRSLLESNAAEQAARRVAMDNATRNAQDLIKALELQYNKERQAAITKEMLEIVSGADALQG